MRRTMMIALLAAFMMVFTANRSWSAELLMFEQDACEWCERWDEEIGVAYHKTEEGQVATLRRFSIDHDLPPQYEFISSIIYTPTFVLVDEGREIGRIIGYGGEFHFWGLLGEMFKHHSLKARLTDAVSGSDTGT